jgi:predicted GH43/DUF377 family glycosyl hydrolase
LKLLKSDKNPIITPRHDTEWEINGTFNPGATNEQGVIHLLYRAVDTNMISRLGYAQTRNGVQIDFRSSKPVLSPSAEWEEFGCEDPRITNIEGQFYITYTAYSRRGPRIALASTKDFHNFQKYGVIGPNYDDKDCVIFPERIDGKIALLHRLQSKVQIAYFEDFGSLTDSQTFWDSYMTHFDEYEVMRSEFSWEKRKIGIGPPPLKTEFGWLVVYHGVSIDNIYRAGAALLDLDDPSKVLARTKRPILEPETEFEKWGIVPNVVFPDGAVIFEGKLMVYYGGADKVCCVASTPFKQLIAKLNSV